MFERFTDRARRVVVQAQEEARRLNHNYIGTEHILLGLIQEGEGHAAKALEELNINIDSVRSEVVEIIGEGQQSPSGHIPFTPRAKKVLELSLREALQLGHNYITHFSSPTQIPGTTWSKIASYGYGTITTKTDGTLWTWGANNFGMLGLNNTTAYSSPKQVPGSTWGTSIGGGNQFGAAVKTDGTLWMWGVNEYGMLGQNDKTNYSSPRQVPGTTWSKVSGMQHNVIAVKTDGTAWSWGLNDGGQLGLNDLIYRSSPTQIPGTTWNNITTSQYNTLAVKTDGTLWGWGNNGQGQLGQNAVNNNGLSSPVQIPGTGWNTGDREFGTTWLGFRATKIL